MLQQGQSDDDDDDGDDEDDDGDDDDGTDDGNDDDFPRREGAGKPPEFLQAGGSGAKNNTSMYPWQEELHQATVAKPKRIIIAHNMSRKSCQPRHDKEGDVDDHDDAG